MNGTPRPRKSWWGRNWFWVVPVGCLGVCAFPFAIIAGIFGLIFGTMTTSSAYADAVELARSHPEVIRELGEPIETGWAILGNFDMSPTSGHMDVSVPLSGPLGEGRLYILAGKEAGEWAFQRLELKVEGREDRIDLLAGAEAYPDRPELEAGDPATPGLP